MVLKDSNGRALDAAYLAEMLALTDSLFEQLERVLALQPVLSRVIADVVGVITEGRTYSINSFYGCRGALDGEERALRGAAAFLMDQPPCRETDKNAANTYVPNELRVLFARWQECNTNVSNLPPDREWEATKTFHRHVSDIRGLSNTLRDRIKQVEELPFIHEDQVAVLKAGVAALIAHGERAVTNALTRVPPRVQSRQRGLQAPPLPGQSYDRDFLELD